MTRTRIFHFIVITFAVTMPIACDEKEEPQAPSVTVLSGDTTNTTSVTGASLRIFQMDNSWGDFPTKSLKLAAELEAFINSDQYEIIKVSTTRSTSGSLTSAEVFYRAKGTE